MTSAKRPSKPDNFHANGNVDGKNGRSPVLVGRIVVGTLGKGCCQNSWKYV